MYGKNIKTRTNDDSLRRHKWPTEFQEVPRVDEFVQAESGQLAKVCRVTHGMEKEYTDGTSYSMRPVIILEITLPW